MPTGSSADVSRWIVQRIERELAEMEQRDTEVAGLVDRARHQHGSRSSVVFTLRLDPDELAALELRAKGVGLRPSVLARNLIRVGLRGRGEAASRDRWVEAIDRLEAAAADVRALIR